MPRQTTNRNDVIPELVDPRWLLKMLVGCALAALFCAYLLVCIVFSVTQWQLVLHPSHDLRRTPRDLGLDFEEVHFATDATGQPQLAGWWIRSATPTQATALVLNNNSGTMADSLDDAQALHNAGFNVFTFDYRGFGHSGSTHPSQARVFEDADSAYQYLRTRGIPSAKLLAVGDGVGAAVATHLCATHGEIAALLLIAPDGDLGDRAHLNVRSNIVPFRLLFHEDFALATPLMTLSTPKLIITFTDTRPSYDPQTAATPKMAVALKKRTDATDIPAALARFLDSYAPTVHP